MPPTVTAAQKRVAFREALASGRLLRFPGAFSPLVASLIEDLGFEGVYVGGSTISADLAVPDIGVTTMTEVTERGRAIARVTSLPTIIDVDTGFGETVNVARTIWTLEEVGLAGCHMEDQVNPKRCGHLDGKAVVEVAEATQRIAAAATARTDPNFLIIARTDARELEGLDAAIDRLKAYVDAGADMVFPEAMYDEADFEKVRKAVDVPVLANMTEFGKSKLLDVSTLTDLGINIVIYPATTLRLAMGAVEDGLKAIRDEGSQASVLDRMQTRQRLYEINGYTDYDTFDASVITFQQEFRHS